MDKKIEDFIHDCLKTCFDFISPKLNNYSIFSKDLSKVKNIKEGGNIQYNFDVEIDKLIKEKLLNHKITGKIFSEESGFFINGKEIYRVVYDPFCNSSLAARNFRESAMGISIFDWNYNFICSAILDYQTGLVGFASDEKTSFYQIQTWETIDVKKTDINSIEKAWAVITLENKEERTHISKVSKLLKGAYRVLVSSGHIYWLKLAMGDIDIYMDPIGGEKLYEMFAATVAQKSGVLVTNLKGEEFDAKKYLKIFEENTNFIYYPVAANKNLHKYLKID